MDICRWTIFARSSEIELIIMDNIAYGMIIYWISKRNRQDGAY